MIIENISPIDLRDFAKSQGWVQQENLSKTPIYIMSHPDFTYRQLVFPKTSQAPDYADAVVSSINKLATLSKQTPDTIYHNVLGIQDDHLRFRIDANHLKQESLPLAFAGQVVQATEKLIKAAACSVATPRLHHPRLHSATAQELIQKSRFGHTESGSFVFNVSCPLNAVDEPAQLDLGDNTAPFVRQVTLLIRQGIFELIQAIENDTLSDFVSQLKKASMPLVSTHFCEALQMMHDEDLDNALDLGFIWSSRHSLSSPELHRPLRIPNAYFARIEEVQREIRPQEQDHLRTFVGSVETLMGELNSQGQREGDVILSVLEEGDSLRIRARLNAEQYADAIDAHKNENSHVMLKGKLQPGRQPRLLNTVESFALLQNA